jgi:hypothetical protein
MSVPAVAWPEPATDTPSTPRLGLVPPAPRQTVGDLAAALRTAGFVQSADCLARASDDPVERARAEEWAAIAVADRALTETMLRHGRPAIPAVHVDAQGGPRFVITGEEPGALVDALLVEHTGTGVDAELRLFLDEALRPGDGMIDAAPGLGFAALSAATVCDDVTVLALHDDARAAAALTCSAELSGCAARVAATPAMRLDQLVLPSAILGAIVLHAGDAAAVAPLLEGARGLLAQGRVGVVAWRRSRDGHVDATGAAIATAVLDVLGFSHFALAMGSQGIELVPAAAVSGNDMVFSLSAGFLARAAA